MRIVSWILILTTLLFVACAFPACGSAGGGTFGETACVQCIEGACASEAAACDAVPECKAYWDCVLACPAKNDHEVDGACADKCPKDVGAASSAYGACFKSQLESPAAGTCAGSCD
jgi:hypothetical protein